MHNLIKYKHWKGHKYIQETFTYSYFQQGKWENVPDNYADSK